MVGQQHNGYRAPPSRGGGHHQVGRKASPAEATRLRNEVRATHAIRRVHHTLDQLDRELAELSLIEYAQQMWPVIEPGREMKVGWAVEAICEHLEAVTNGQVKRLLVNVPPGMMKSLLVQVFWPSWEWGPRNLPHLRYVSASYSQSLTIRDNRRARQLIASSAYQRWWGDRFSISPDQDAKERYDNTARGFRIATTVGGLGTGERGDRFIIDDPHNVKTAESEADLTEKTQWFTEVVPSRVNDLRESAFIMIMQRVHERDLSGVALAADLGYVHLNLPMEFEADRRCFTVVPSSYHLEGQATFTDPRTEEGELLFPERFDREGVDGLKKQLSSWGGDYAVAGQLQQRPAPRGGGMFKRAAVGPPETWLDAAPPGGRVIRGWDLAGSTRKTSPFTASVRLKEVGGTYYITSVTRDRMEVEDAEARVVEVTRDDGYGTLQSLPQDPGSAGKSQKAHLGKALDGWDFKITPESGSKEDRAVPIASQWNNGNVKLVKGPWNEPFLAELASFPRGAFKDQVDALSRAYGEHMTGREPGTPVGPREIARDQSTNLDLAPPVDEDEAALSAVADRWL